MSSADGLDELSTSGPTHVVEVEGEQLRRYVVEPEECGLQRGAFEDVAGGTPEDNARDVRAILAGEPGPRTDLALLNAGAAIYAGGPRGLDRRGRRAGARRRVERRRAGGARAPTWRSENDLAGRRVSVLDRIIDATREEVARRSRAVPLAELERGLSARGPDRPFAEALGRPGVVGDRRVQAPLAERRRHPRGRDRRGDRRAPTRRAGAAALSVLTEGPNFGGSLDDLRAARAASELPILRKDFVVDRYQLVESAVAGADAVLLIVAALEDRELAALHAAAVELDLDVLVEVHTDEELERALEVVDPDLIGINNRDLGDFSRRRRAHLRAARRRPRRQDGRQRVGASTRASSCSSSSASASTRC